MPWREDIGAAPPLPDDPGQEDGNGREEEQLGAVQAGPDDLLAAGELDAEPEDAVCREVDDEGLACIRSRRTRQRTTKAMAWKAIS